MTQFVLAKYLKKSLTVVILKSQVHNWLCYGGFLLRLINVLISWSVPMIGHVSSSLCFTHYWSRYIFVFKSSYYLGFLQFQKWHLECFLIILQKFNRLLLKCIMITLCKYSFNFSKWIFKARSIMLHNFSSTAAAYYANMIYEKMNFR